MYIFFCRNPQIFELWFDLNLLFKAQAIYILRKSYL